MNHITRKRQATVFAAIAFVVALAHAGFMHWLVEGRIISASVATTLLTPVGAYFLWITMNGSPKFIRLRAVSTGILTQVLISYIGPLAWGVCYTIKRNEPLGWDIFGKPVFITIIHFTAIGWFPAIILAITGYAIANRIK